MSGYVILKVDDLGATMHNLRLLPGADVVHSAYRVSALLESAPVQDAVEQEVLNDVNRNYGAAVKEFGPDVKLRPYLGIFSDPERVQAVQGLRLFVPDDKATAELQQELALQFPALPVEGDPDDDVMLTVTKDEAVPNDVIHDAEFAAGCDEDDEPEDTVVWADAPAVGDALK